MGIVKQKISLPYAITKYSNLTQKINMLN